MPNPEQEKFSLEIPVKKEFLEQIKNGVKTADARPSYAIPIKPMPGEKVLFFSSSDSTSVTIASLETYKNLDYLLKSNTTLDRFGQGITEKNARSVWAKLYPDYKGGQITVLNFKTNDHPRN